MRSVDSSGGGKQGDLTRGSITNGEGCSNGSPTSISDESWPMIVW